MGSSKALMIQKPRFEKIKDLFNQIIPKIKNFDILQRKEGFLADDMGWAADILRNAIERIQSMTEEPITVPQGDDTKTVFVLLKQVGKLAGQLYKSLIRSGYTTDDLAALAADLSQINDHFRSFSTLNESVNTNAINMLIRKFEDNIKTPDDVSGFFTNLNNVGMMFNPDDDFLAEPGITPLQADKLNDIMKACWEVCNEFGSDIYEIGISVVNPEQTEEEVTEEEELKTWGKDAEVLQPLEEEDVEDDGLIQFNASNEDLERFVASVNEDAGDDDALKSELAYKLCSDYDEDRLKQISKSLAAAGEYAILIGVSEALLDKQGSKYAISKEEPAEAVKPSYSDDQAYFEDDVEEPVNDLVEEAIENSGWDMNDPDVYKDTLEELVHFVKSVRQKSIKSGNDKEVAYEMSSVYDTAQLNGFLHILASHPEMKKIADGIQMRANGETEEQENPLCSNCNGTGEGPASGTTCSSCKGSGVYNQAESNRINFGRKTNNLEEDDEPEYDGEYEEEIPDENGAEMNEEVDSFIHDMNQGRYFTALSIKNKAKELSSKYSTDFLEFLASALDQNNQGNNHYDIMAQGVRENLGNF